MSDLETEIERIVERVLARRQPTPAPEPAAPEYLSTREAARYTGYSPLTLRQWRHEGDGPPHCGEGRRVRYRRADLDAWLATNRRGR